MTSLKVWIALVCVEAYLRLSCHAQLCEDGWIQFYDNENKGLCVRIVEGPAGWTEARKVCQGWLAHLAHVDRFQEYSVTTGKQIPQSIADAVFERNITEFWTGLYVENGRLLLDDYGPKFVIKPQYGGSNQWYWGSGQPSIRGGNCGSATLVVRQNDDLSNVPTGRLDVNLVDCEQPVSFLCQKSPIEEQVKTASFCPEGWAGNQYLSYCYNIFKEPFTQPEAEKMCTKEGGQLAPSLSAFDETFLRAVYSFFMKYDRYFEVTQIDAIWVENSNETELCRAFNPGIFSEIPRYIEEVECSKELLYMCVKPTQFSRFGDLAMDSPYFDQNELLQYKPFETLPVYGHYERNLREGETVFVRTPSFILNSSQSYYQWNYDNTVNWDVRDSDRVATPYFVNVSIPRSSGQQFRKKRVAEGSGTSTESPLYPVDFTNEPLFVDYDYVRRTTGNYTFGIYNINPPKYTELEQRLVRYSERYLYIYVAYLDYQDGFVLPRAQEGRVAVEELNSFNLLQDDSYIGILWEVGGAYDFLDFEPKELSGLVSYYKGQFEKFIGSTAMFRIFVAPYITADTPKDFEQIVYYAVENHIKDSADGKMYKMETLKVFSTVRCPFLETTVDGRNLTFNPTRAGQTGFSWERCYPNNKALATAECIGSYTEGVRWGQISLTSGCGFVPELNQSESTISLKNLSETRLTQDNIKDVIQDTVNLTQSGNLTEADIIYTAQILYHYLEFDIASTPEILDKVYQVVNNVLKSLSDVIYSAQKITNAANRIILAVDELTNNLEIFGSDVVQFIQDLVLSEIREQYGSGSLTIGINLNQSEGAEIQKSAISSVQTPDDVDVMETDTAIYLTETLLKGEETRLTFQIYGNPNLFSVVNSRLIVNSKIAAARLTLRDGPVYNLGNEHVTVVFHIFEESDKLVCSYWNYTKNEDAGGWETKGCKLLSYGSGRAVCRCNHLTNFAVLIDPNANTISDTDKLVLGIVTKVGLIISIIGLGITILTFLVFKHLRSGRGQQVLVNLSVAMICSAILFLVGVERTESYGGCIAVAVLLHYFILVTFMWMLVEGVLQYLRFVKVLGTYIPNFMIKSMLPAWGIPLIPVIICLIVDYNMYYGGNGYCWLSWEPFLYAFIIPVAAIILANIIVFFMVLCNLCCRRKHKGMASNQSERKMAFLHFQAGVSILVILGLTWVFGFLTVDSTRIVFHYLFAIFNAFQGLFIFLLFTAREKQIRKAWKKLCCKKSPYKSSTSGTDSQPPKQSMDTNSTGLLSKSGGSNPNSTYNGNRALHFNNRQYDEDT